MFHPYPCHHTFFTSQSIPTFPEIFFNVLLLLMALLSILVLLLHTTPQGRELRCTQKASNTHHTTCKICMDYMADMKISSWQLRI